MKPQWSKSFSSTIMSGAISQNENYWALGMITGQLSLFSKTNPDTCFDFYNCTGSVRAICFNSMSDSFCSGDKSGNIFVTDINSEKILYSRKGAHKESIECIKYVDSNTLAVGDTGGAVKLWDIRDDKVINTFKYENNYIVDLDVVEGTHLVICNAEGVVSVVKLSNGKRYQYYQQEDDDFSAMTICYGYQYPKILVASSKPRIYVVKFPDLDFICEAAANTDSPVVMANQIKTRSDRIVTAQEDGSVSILDICPNRSIYAFRAHDKKASLYGAHNVGNKTLTWASDNSAKMWDIEEIANMDYVKPSKRRTKNQKKKKRTVKVEEERDDFFSSLM